ncbi:dihydrofolate reductase [Deinococcus metalli]|uniref:Dihydrofolate reductase n=1 Tax=Deinococcus metalli TaxID=1141878 RepID=A0A7W8KH23_9DEIO|nr:dihydrofolate reductase family protein [Deinococcus metalli]MBB5377003.1 dihydrofolate reductase [Deinococcus metalli]
MPTPHRNPPVSRVFLDLAVSLDGFIAGPNGEDGGLHDWYFAPGAAEDLKAELLGSIGAIILGARAFGTAPDGFDTPYHVPHFILTHHARPSVTRGGAAFHFVTGGIESAVDQARAAAGDRDVCVAGGADVARQFLHAGLLDEIQLHLVPVLLGGGLPLFRDADPGRLTHVRTVQSAHATHLTYRLSTRKET